MHRFLVLGVIAAGAWAARDQIAEIPVPDRSGHGPGTTVWEMKRVGEGQRCTLALSPADAGGAHAAELGEGCEAIDASLTGSIIATAAGDRMVFSRPDGTEVLAFAAADGDVYESIRTDRGIIVLGRGR